MNYSEYIKKNNKNFTGNIYIGAFQFFVTFTKIENSNELIDSKVLVYIYYLSLKYLELTFRQYDDLNIDIDIDKQCDDFLIYILNLNNIDNINLCEIFSSCVQLPIIRKKIKKQDENNEDNKYDEEGDYNIKNYINNYLDIFNFFSNKYEFEYDISSNKITYKNKQINYLKKKLNHQKKILKNEFINDLIGSISFGIIYNKFMHNAEQEFLLNVNQHDFLPLNDLGNEYINYINEKPSNLHNTNYILVKILMLEDFLDIYKNYSDTENIKLINIENVKKNLILFSNIIKD